MTELLTSNGGAYPMVPPREISRQRALCKQVVLRGNDIDLTRFPFLKTNPADAGRCVNTGSVFTSDPELGSNFGTYRCQLRGPRQLGINSEPGHTGHRMFMAAKQRGEKSVPVSIVLGQDPVTWVVSGAPIARRTDKPLDELALVGGLRGKALEVVKSESNDMLIPAHAEMVIEGEVPLDEPLLPEGPFGEMFGYLGLRKEQNFWVRVTAVTHRRDPWFMNSFTGMHRGYVTSTMEALYDHLMRRLVPNLVEFHYPQDMMGVAFLSIDKTAPGQGMEAGRRIAARIPIVKVMVVVDKDMDVLNRSDMLFAMGSRWQPHPASEIMRDARGIVTDPSQTERGKTSKIVIDATRQWPEEGGPEVYPGLNRTLLKEGAPEVFDLVRRRHGHVLNSWKVV